MKWLSSFRTSWHCRMKDGLIVGSDQASDQGRVRRRDESFVRSSKFRVSLRAKEVVCLSTRRVVDTDADVRDKCTVHVDEFKCNGSKSLSRHRSFLSVMLCDFLTARAGTHVTSGPSFLDSQALHRTLVFHNCRRTSPFFRSLSPSLRSSDSSIHLRRFSVLSTCTAQVAFTWRLVLRLPPPASFCNMCAPALIFLSLLLSFRF